MTDHPFQLSGFTMPGVDEDPFGIWDIAPATDNVSFAAGDAAKPEEPVHRFNSLTPEDGTALLQAAQQTLQVQHDALTQIEQRLASGQRRILCSPDRSAAALRAA